MRRGPHPPPGSHPVAVAQPRGAHRGPCADVRGQHRRKQQTRTQCPPGDEEVRSRANVSADPQSQGEEACAVHKKNGESQGHEHLRNAIKPLSRTLFTRTWYIEGCFSCFSEPAALRLRGNRSSPSLSKARACCPSRQQCPEWEPVRRLPTWNTVGSRPVYRPRPRRSRLDTLCPCQGTSRCGRRFTMSPTISRWARSEPTQSKRRGES